MFFFNIYVILIGILFFVTIQRQFIFWTCVLFCSMNSPWVSYFCFIFVWWLYYILSENHIKLKIQNTENCVFQNLNTWVELSIEETKWLIFDLQTWLFHSCHFVWSDFWKLEKKTKKHCISKQHFSFLAHQHSWHSWTSIHYTILLLYLHFSNWQCTAHIQRNQLIKLYTV